MKTALLLIDIQNDYFPGGRMELDGSPEASLRAKDLLTLFRDRNLPIFHIQHISNRTGASFFLPDTAGVEFHANVSPLPGETIIRKNFPNSFRNTALLTHLKDAEVNQLVICGMMTHMCVDATVRAAFDHGFDCVAIHDACATRGLTFNGEEIPPGKVHGAFLAALGAVYARVCSSADFAAEVVEKGP
jgi:nicotinamidase-related amidase